MNTEFGVKFMTWFTPDYTGNMRPGCPYPTNWRAFVLVNFVNGAK